jgi:O-methyltransferase involved in polyketide biosynthesis
MSEICRQDLGGVSETLLVTLHRRAMESQRLDALIKDEKAVERGPARSQTLVCPDSRASMVARRRRYRIRAKTSANWMDVVIMVENCSK